MTLRLWRGVANSRSACSRRLGMFSSDVDGMLGTSGAGIAAARGVGEGGGRGLLYLPCKLCNMLRRMLAASWLEGGEAEGARLMPGGAAGLLLHLRVLLRGAHAASRGALALLADIMRARRTGCRTQCARQRKLALRHRQHRRGRARLGLTGFLLCRCCAWLPYLPRRLR